jgi:hypothetical protein
MRFTDYFDKIRIISLPSRLDRRRQIAREFERHGMPVDGGKVEFFDAIRPEHEGGFGSIGLHGCFLSHLEILRQSRAAGLSRVVHVEDDLQLPRRFVAYQEPMVAALSEQPWDIAYFGHVMKLDAGRPYWVPHPAAERVELTHFFAVNGSVFDRLIAFLEASMTRPVGHPEGGPASPDGAISMFRHFNPDVVTLVANPSLGWQRSSRTDAHELRWFDRAPVIKDVVGVLRQCRAWTTSYR